MLLVTRLAPPSVEAAGTVAGMGGWTLVARETACSGCVWPGLAAGALLQGMESRNLQGHRAPTINHLFTHGVGKHSLLCKAQRRNGTWVQLAESVGKEEGIQPKRPGVGMVASN